MEVENYSAPVFFLESVSLSRKVMGAMVHGMEMHAGIEANLVMSPRRADVKMLAKLQACNVLFPVLCI